MTALALIVALLVGSLLLHTLAIKFGAKWAKVPGVSLWRAVVATLVLAVVSAILVVAVDWFSKQIKATLWGAIILSIIVVAVAESLLLASLLRTSVWRSALVWLPRQGATVVLLSVLFFVVKPFVVEGVVQESHSMAPTLLGTHTTGTCPHCGGVATVAVQMELPPGERGDRFGICSDCKQTSETKVPPQMKTPWFGGDRVAVCKLLPPARWDVVTVNSPAPQSLLMTRRVVGLPGEEVTIRDGGIWVNGTKQEPPADIAKLQFTTAPEGSPAGWGTPDKPARLGPDEYFVIGDFSLRSVDSRTWGPMPRKDITGVVSLIFFPFDRVRLLK